MRLTRLSAALILCRKDKVASSDEALEVVDSCLIIDVQAGQGYYVKV
jgi:hypothetical protein